MRVRLLLLVLLSTLPALVLTLYTGLEQRRLSAANSREYALSLTNLAARQQASQVERALQLFDILAKLPAVTGGNPDDCNALLTSLQAQYPDYTSLNLAETDGDIVCTSLAAPERVNISDRPYFQKVVQTGQVAVGQYTVDRLSKKGILPLAYPVVDQTGEMQAVLIGAANIEWLNQSFAQIDLPEGAALLSIDSEGTILARYPNPTEWVGRSMGEAPIIQSMISSDGEGTIETIGVDGVSRLYAFTSIRHEDIYVADVGIGIPLEIAFREENQALLRNLISLGVVTALALLGAWIFGSFLLLRPVHAMLLSTRRLESGDLKARTNLSYDLGEIGELAKAFDGMAEALERRQAELVEAQNSYRVLVEHIPPVVYTALPGETGKTVYISPQAQLVLGYSPEEWLGDPEIWQKNIHKDDRERIITKLAKARATGEPFKAEYRWRNRSGKWIWIQDEAVVVEGANGRQAFLQGVMTDITATKKAEASLGRYATQLERSNRELQDFAYITSHDLQEPLRKIQAFGERLTNKYAGQLDETGLFYIQRMQSSAARMQSLINDLLSYSRVSTRARPFEKVDMNQVIAGVLEDLEEQIKQSGGRVEVKPLPEIDADPVQMGQLLQNLVSNALKFHKPDQPPVVQIYGQVLNRNQVEIRVEDQGIGFEPKYLNRIFQPFQRLHAREEYEGSGIGLAICRKIVDRHDGTITAETKSGEGSTFIVHLPVYQINKTEGEDQ